MRSWCLCLVAVSCVACNDEATRGGLVLMVVQDGSLAPDSLRLSYAAPDQDANEARWAMPEQAELPLTITLEAREGSASEVTIDGSLWSDDVRLDRRTFTVSNIPKNRYAALELLFGARCSPVNSGAPECSSGQTCDPRNGVCVSQDIDAAELPDYAPELEAELTWDPPSERDAGATSADTGVSLSSAAADSAADGSQTSTSVGSRLDGGSDAAQSEPQGTESSTLATSDATSDSIGTEPGATASPDSETRLSTTGATDGETATDSDPNHNSTSTPTGSDYVSDTAGPACTDGDYWHDGMCTPWDTCVAGYYVLVEGTDEANRVCEPCAPDTFSADDNWAECLPFTHCGFREQESDGSPSDDVTCAEGDVVFQFGSVDGDTASGVAVDAEGSVYVVGYTDGETFATNAGGWDAFIQKRTPTGGIAWSEQFGTTSYDRAHGVVANANGDVTVVGSTEGDLAPGGSALADVFLRRYEANGDVAWTSQYGTPNLDMAYSVAETAAGSLVVTGRTYGTFSGNNPDGADFFVSSFSAEGAHEWSQQIGDNEDDYRGTAITLDASGDIVAVGITLAGFGGDDVTIIKLTPAGVISFVYSFGSSAQDVPMAVVTDEEDNIYVAGYSYGKLGANDPQGVDAWVSKRNPAGDLIWIDQFGTNVEDAALAMAIHDSSLYVAGQWGNESDLADDQAFVRRYDLDGTDPVNHVFGTNKPEYAYGLAVTSDRIFVCGDTSGDFGGTNAGRYDAFLSQVVLP
jgi:hypothetical protein